MQVVDDLTKLSLRQESVLTIGVFDGVHLGHQALIRQVVARARALDRLAALLTFHPHPATVIALDHAPRSLTTLGEKLVLLQALGLDLVALLPFDRTIAATPALDFMRTVCRQLRMRELWVGSDFALGRGREGNVARLQEIGRDLDFQVRVTEPVTNSLGGHSAISSSRIRALVLDGRVHEAAQLLGRYPSLSGAVVAGAQRGRKLGFPTANLDVRPERAVPANGVYAAFAVLGTTRYPAVANVGVRPSFDNGERTVETHILGFDQEIYGCDLVVEFVERLRDETRFDSIDDLVAQIKADVQRAQDILGQVIALPTMDGCRDAAEASPSADCTYRAYEIDHTADRALRVWGKTQADLFIGSARGMVRLMADLDAVAATTWRQVRLEAADVETLLVRWLNELLFRMEAEGLLFSDFRVDLSSDNRLVAHLGGDRGQVTKAHIKAATFHDLEIIRDGSGWSTVITFDV